MINDLLDLGDDWLGKAILVLIALACLSCVAVLGIAIRDVTWRMTHECVHYGVVHRAAYTQLIPVGKMLIPIFQPEHDESVCEEWRVK